MKKNILLFTILLALMSCQAGKDNSIIYESDHSTNETSSYTSEVTKNQEKNTFEDYLSKVDSIVEPSNISWPRVIKINEIEFVIKTKPERVATISLGHDEILFGITDSKQIVATTTFAQEQGSNIKIKSNGLPTISSDPETIIAENPEIIFADPYASVELIDALEDFGIIVIQTKLNNTIEGRKNDIWLMSYITGNLPNGKELVQKIDNNIKSIQSLVNSQNITKQEIVTLSWWDAYWTAGSGSTEDSVIQLAGAINLSSENGVQSNATIDKELLILMNPEIILITQSALWGGEDFYNELLKDDSLSSIDAIKNNNVYMVNSSWWSTLSYWNIKGVEELAKILYEIDVIEGFVVFE